MASDDIQRLSSFLNKLNQSKNKSFTTIEAIEDAEQQNGILNVNVSQKEKKLQYLQKCLKENGNCNFLLNILESSINQLLEKCAKEQKIVNENIQMCLKKQGYSNRIRDCYIRKILRMPYFKDDNGFSPPPNVDVFKRRVEGFLSPHKVLIPRLWDETEKKVVTQYIRRVEEEKWTETLKSCGMLHLANVEQMSLKELVESRLDEYDWLNISVSCLKNAHSPEECRTLWFSCLHPLINQQVWPSEENEKLKSLVVRYESEDWDAIVRELGTKRSAFQCIIHYKTLLRGVGERQWTEKETSLLNYYVKLFCFKAHIPFGTVQKFMDGRNWYEVFRMWNKINHEGKRRTFSLEEDIVLVAGLKAFGHDYCRIQEYLPDRSFYQVGQRITVLKNRQFPARPWSAQEDNLLKNLMNKYGYGNWWKISTHFVNRSQNSVRGRCLILLKSKGGKPCPSVAIKHRKTDIVTIPLLWECVVNICQENNICFSSDTMEKYSSTNIVRELSRLLEPRIPVCKTVAEDKLRPILDREYNNFFRGAYVLNEGKRERISHLNKITHTFVHDVVMVLKLLGAKVKLPITEELKMDTAISEKDKWVIEYLINKIGTKSNVGSNIFLSHNGHKKNMVVDETDEASNNSENVYMFPPNLSTFLAMRSLLLNRKNREQQIQGLTMQVDNVEMKDMNTFCSPRKIFYGENHSVASKRWRERMNQLLGGVALVLSKQRKSCLDRLHNGENQQ